MGKRQKPTTQTIQPDGAAFSSRIHAGFCAAIFA
jgi:hypothetical protein